VQHTEECASTRDKILDTALRLFSKEGYLGATTREIAREAGIAEVTLFRHFASKEALFEEVINRNSFLPALKGTLPEIRDLSYEEALTVIARRFIETLILKKDLIRIMNSEMQRYPDKIRKINQTIIDGTFKTLAAYFGEMQKKGMLRRFDPQAAAQAFLGMMFSYFNVEEILLHKKYRSVDTNATIKRFIDIFMRGTLK
jgi:AcrR family transcriptional regulator